MRTFGFVRLVHNKEVCTLYSFCDYSHRRVTIIYMLPRSQTLYNVIHQLRQLSVPRSRVHFTSSHRLVRTPTSGSRTKVCFIHDFRQLQVFKALPTDNLVVKDVNDFINM